MNPEESEIITQKREKHVKVHGAFEGTAWWPNNTGNKGPSGLILDSENQQVTSYKALNILRKCKLSKILNGSGINISDN